MIVVCERCNSRLQLDKRQLTHPVGNLSIRCPNCKHSFTIELTGEPEPISAIQLSYDKNSTRSSFTIVVTNQKGGVAKTSTCLNLGLSLALLEKRVLLIDFDVQANLTISMGYSKDTTSFYNLVRDEHQNIESALIQTSYPGLWLLPSNKNMVLLSKKYFGTNEYEYILHKRLSSVKNCFDYIIIDTPPSIEFFTINALTTADLAIIPTHCDYLSTHGIEQVLNIIGLIRRKTNPTIDARILVTKYDENATASRMIFSKLKDLHPSRMYQTVIPHDERLREAQIMSMPVINYDQRSQSGLQYMALAQEIINPQPKNS